MEVVRPHVDLEVVETQPQYSNANSHIQNNSYSYDSNSGYDVHNSKGTSPASFAPHSNTTPPERPEVAEGLEHGSAPSKHRRAWLLPAAIAAGLAALLVGALVGGGLGATLNSCQSELEKTSMQLGTLLSAEPNSAATETPTPSGSAGGSPSFSTTANGLFVAYYPAVPAMVDTLNTNCIALAEQNQTSAQNEVFSVHCGVDLGWGAKSAVGGGDVFVADIVGILVYSFEACIEACSTLNLFETRFKAGTKCHAVVFSWSLANSWSKRKSNCFLKNATAIIARTGGLKTALTAVLLD
ncbi:serine/threonine kinase PknH [Microdochium nivale]|nr:serine/threonine kinase PknH [Microdochium nivale]